MYGRHTGRQKKGNGVLALVLRGDHSIYPMVVE